VSAAETSGVVRSIRYLLGFAGLLGFTAFRGEAAPIEQTEFSPAADFRLGRARLLMEREAELAALRADIERMLDSSRSCRIARR